MHAMSRDEWRQFVLKDTRTGKIGITRASGAPHVTPVWFVLDEIDGTDYVVFNTGRDSLKGKALRRDPRFALTVDEEVAPYGFVLLEAEAELSEEPGELLDWAIRIGTRYMGPEQGEEFGRRNGVPGEYLVRGRITRVTAQADLTG
jgi:PPOX class probable F420-dependent enzyme